jgi:hypothetical protein
MRTLITRTSSAATAAAAVLLTLAGAGASPAGAATAGPRPVSPPAHTGAVTAGPVTVVPSTGLAGGDTVAVSAAGITPSAVVQVIQCSKNYFELESAGYACPLGTTTNADSAGHVSVDITLADPVHVSDPVGEDLPVYCRADHCRIFLVWNDSSGEQQAIASPRLFFQGAPATIAAKPATNLRAKQFVRVTGTVSGASGRTLLIREEACFEIIQGRGCYGARHAVWTVVRPGGFYAAYYPVRRFLADGTDCTDPNILGSCELNVTVLTHKGSPDDSFGVSYFGEPAAWLSFQTG